MMFSSQWSTIAADSASPSSQCWLSDVSQPLPKAKPTRGPKLKSCVQKLFYPLLKKYTESEENLYF